MRTLKLLVTAAAALALAVSPGTARASGFGWGGRSNKSEKSNSKSKSKSKSSSSSSGQTRSGGFGWRGTTDRGYHVYTGNRGSYGRGDYDRGYHHWHDGYYQGGYSYDHPRPYGRIVVEPYYSSWGVYPYGYYAYGYYPYWGAPPITEAPAAPSTTTAELFLGGMGGALPAAIGSLSIDGERWGFNLGGAVIQGPSPDGSQIALMPLGSLHLTYSLIADPHSRVRVELGASSVVGVGVAYYGPDVGASAQLAILGPLALEGSVHLTPLPASILDLEADAALHFGALGVKGGWRVLRLDDYSGHVDDFSGPELAVGVVW